MQPRYNSLLVHTPLQIAIQAVEMALLSKIDVCLGGVRSKQWVDLSGDNSGITSADDTALNKEIDTVHYAYTIRLKNETYVAYNLSENYTVLTLYSLCGGSTVHVQLPHPLMNHHHTLAVLENDEIITFLLVLIDGSLLELTWDVRTFVTDENNKKLMAPKNVDLQTPYDFTVRRAHSIVAVHKSLYVVLLEDGGLLGLKSSAGHWEPLLFNDSSFIRSLTKFWRRDNGKSHGAGKALSSIVFNERFLIIFDEFAVLSIWDVYTLNLVHQQQLNLDKLNHKHERIPQDANSHYMSLFDDLLIVYLPFGAGVFQLGRLVQDPEKNLTFEPCGQYESTLSASSIWSLVDVKLAHFNDLFLTDSQLNVIVLWKSGNLSKLQILNLKSIENGDYEWKESVNKSIDDLQYTLPDHEGRTFDQRLLLLQKTFGSSVYNKAFNLLSKNGITLNQARTTEQEENYLGNLETILHDIYDQYSEASSLTLYNDDILLVNCLGLYHHTVYKTNSSIEKYYLANCVDEMNQQPVLFRFLKTVQGFISTLPKEAFTNCSKGFIDFEVEARVSAKTPNERFTEIFQSCLQGKFELNNLQLLFDQLSSFDMIPILNDLIDNHLCCLPTSHASLIEAMSLNLLDAFINLESLRQIISIHHDIVLSILIIFAFLDFDYTNFRAQISTLLDLHFKQCLFLRFYQLDKTELIQTLLQNTSHYNCGMKLYSSADWLNYEARLISTIYQFDQETNHIFLVFFKKYVIQTRNSIHLSDKEIFLRTIARPFRIHGDILSELLLAMAEFTCGYFKESYDLFSKNDYPSLLENGLPHSITSLFEEESNPWLDIILSLDSSHSSSAFTYALSKLFAGQEPGTQYALQFAAHSVEFSMKHMDLEETKEFKEAQYSHYLDILVHFDMFEEVIDILRLSRDHLSNEMKKKYYAKLLNMGTQIGDAFFQVLLKVCYSSMRADDAESVGLPLPLMDFEIIDNILVQQLLCDDWLSYKRLYSFRTVNGRQREAAQAVFEFLQLQPENEVDTRKKCLLVVINILSTFQSPLDQWILKGSEIVTLTDLREQYKVECT